MGTKGHSPSPSPFSLAPSGGAAGPGLGSAPGVSVDGNPGTPKRVALLVDMSDIGILIRYDNDAIFRDSCRRARPRRRPRSTPSEAAHPDGSAFTRPQSAKVTDSSAMSAGTAEAAAALDA